MILILTESDPIHNVNLVKCINNLVKCSVVAN